MEAKTAFSLADCIQILLHGFTHPSSPSLLHPEFPAFASLDPLSGAREKTQTRAVSTQSYV